MIAFNPPCICVMPTINNNADHLFGFVKECDFAVLFYGVRNYTKKKDDPFLFIQHFVI